MNVTSNVSLVNLWCSYNQLSNIDISQNRLLVGFYVDNNNLSSIDFINNDSLSTINCNNNQLTGLDLSNIPPSFYQVTCSHNLLTYIYLPDSVLNAKGLICDYNQIDTINFSNLDTCYFQTYLDLSNNNLTSLDLSNIYFDEGFKCDSNQLISLDLKNGYNTNIYDISALGNPNLNCIT